MGFFSFFADLFFKSAKNIPIDSMFIGLGNLGNEYSSTRHNIGFRVADALIERLKFQKKFRSTDADFVTGTLDSGKRVLVAKPRTLMNRSGVAVERLTRQFNVELSALMIFVDDFNIPLGTIRARRGGSHGGHNGLKSINAYVGPDFPRLRIGIGPLPEGVDVIKFVLGDFSTKEECLLKEVILKAVDAAVVFAESCDINIVMNKYNK